MTETTTPPAANTDADKAAAHQFLSELNTRIATQPLPYQYGVETRALQSLFELFGFARDAMKKYPGCKVFAEAVTKMLNEDLRPVTAKWHRALEEGVLASRDGADEFRGDLQDVQEILSEFAIRLQHMAYGAEFPGIDAPEVMPPDQLKKCLEDVVFGLGRHPPIPPETIAAINLAEAEEVRQRRRVRGATAPDRCNAVGLGLSGGGIRSAIFCLGVTQVLAARGLLRDVDFLSTVSGGGYTGSFLTARLGNNEAYADVAGPHGPDPAAIQHLRHHAKYLTAIDLKDRWSMVTATLAGMILNWSAPVFLIALAALGAHLLARIIPGTGWWWTGAFSVGLTFVALLLYGLAMRRFPKYLGISGDLLGLLFAVTVLLGVGWLIGIGIPAAIHSVPAWIGISLGGLAAAGPAVLRFVPVLKTPAVRKFALQVLLWIAGLVIPIGALALFYAFRALPAIELIVIAAASALVAFYLLNVNLTAPHRLYRDRLAAAFIKKKEPTDPPEPPASVNSGNGALPHLINAALSRAAALIQKEPPDPPIPLTAINPGNSAPYHLLNAALNLPSSITPALRDRKCDFFLFSKHWCGSPIAGYHPTGKWLADNAPADLATAMAVSGAAVSPNMGLDSMPSLTALLTFLNVRLGFWIRHPNRPGPENPGFMCLVREMFGVQMAEDRAWLNLSDGAHIENTGVYELLRRRCKYIIGVDGESDPEFTFAGLMTLARHAQIDFGIRIEASLNQLKPDPQTNLSHVHYVLCRVHYPHEGPDRPAATGLLLYLKLSMTGNEPELLKRYRITHPEFPHQSTLDQFFDEEQFEAYHQLGVHIADGLFLPALMSKNTHPPTVAEWFRQLAGNLLKPEAAG